MEKKRYVMPETAVYLIQSKGNVMLTISGEAEHGAGGDNGDGGDGYSKETDWEDEDEDY